MLGSTYPEATWYITSSFFWGAIPTASGHLALPSVDPSAEMSRSVMAVVMAYALALLCLFGPAVAFNCPNNATYKYPDAGYPNQYILCQNGKPTVETCPTNEFFYGGCVCTPVHVRACQSLAGTVVRYILRRHTPACYRFEASTWESLELGVILHFLVDMTSAEIGKMDK
ncbi:hypothetical protein WJX84_010974 [Apatococcus fuscideae]|uniref:Uncharacterized protein n=1 Tax=Apatococcus fuscideae TaxID=2026836 RepID=A0AAW1TBU6_9CHLO